MRKKRNIKFALSWGANSSLFTNSVGIYQFKAKDPEINATPFCLDNISKKLSTDNMKNTGL